ncbi:uncharacterized protein LOC106944688 isoform X1 [Poecilia latipinna]|uniref:uncharacterized protein LOC106944688 isoform X1 n=1 Tax=Poecilia latipinna TaxID=48699 RepID=UPI00072E2257|nr:PREDICTED: uncharacterized protein LOC106944688 isoform X1 [Poecilia latipinna]
MSYLMYDPFSPGTQNASQGQNGLLSVKTERDSWRTPPNDGPESSFTFPGASPGIPTSSTEREMKPFPLPVSNYRPENYLTTSQSTFNIPHKEEIKHQPIDQCGFFTITQKETLSISAPKMSTFSTSYGHQLSSTSYSSYNWLPDHNGTTEVFSKLASNASVYATRAEDQRVSSQASYFDCNPQLAGNILENYGLEKADLDELLNYSEEQTTAQNLPYLLESIRIKKATRTAPAVQSNSDSTTRPTASPTGVDAASFGKPGILEDKMSSSTLHPVKMIKNEQAAAGYAEVDAVIGRNIQRNPLLMDNFQTSSTEESFATLTKIKSGDLGSSGDQKESLVAVNPPSINQTRLLQAQPNQASGLTRSIGFEQTGTPNDKPKIIIKPVKLFDWAYTGKSITDVENTSVKNIHNAAWVGVKDGKQAPQLSFAELKNSSLVSSYDQKVSAANLNQLNVVAFPKRNAAGKLETQQNHTPQSVPQHETRDATSSGESKIQGQGSNIADSTMNLQMLQKTNIQKILQILKDLQPDVSSAAKPDSQSSFIPKMPHVSDAVPPSTVVSKNPASSVSQSQPIIKTNDTAHVPPSKPPPPAKAGSSKDLPSLGVRRDYAAVMPGKFPHICSLCKKECPQLKDWVTHQTSNQHHANCNRLRNQYPHWDGEVQRDAVKSSKTLTRASLHHRSRSYSSSSSSSGDGRDKSISRSRSRSYSPCHQRSSRDGQHKYSSRSGHSKNRSSTGSSSRSYSPICHGSRDGKKQSSGSSSQHRLQCRTSRSRSRSCSPRYNRSGYRSRSRSYEKWSSPKRMNKKSISPRRNHERQLSRGRSCEQRSSPRSDQKEGSKRFLERQSSPRIYDHKQLSPRQWSPRSGYARQMSPKRTDKRWSPTSNGEQFSPTRSGNRRRSPVMSHGQHSSRSNDRLESPQRRTDVSTYDRSPPRRAEGKYWSPPRYHDRQSSPRRNGDKRWSPTRKGESFLERDEKQFLSKQSDEETTSVRRNRKRRASPEEQLSCQKKKSSVQILTNQLLENSAIESGSEESNIKDVVDLVVPVLLAELAKNEDSSQSSLGLPSQDKSRKVLTHSSSERRLSPSSTKILSKLKQKHARSSKKTKDKKALAITSQHGRKHHKLKSGDTKKLSSSESLDLLPIKTLLSLHQKLVKKAKRLSSKGSHVSKSKTYSQKTQTLKSVVSVKEPLKQLVSLRFRSLETRPHFGLSNQRSGPIVFRKDQEDAVKEKMKVKGTRRIIIPEPNEENKTISNVKPDSSKTFASKPLDKTAECCGVVELMKVEDSLGNKQQTSNGSLQAQETIVKTQETSDKTLPKVQPRMDPDSKKSKSLGKNPDSGVTRYKPATKVSRKGKGSQVAVEDGTKVGKMLKKTVAKTKKGKKMVAKVKVKAPKTSTNKKLDETTRCLSEGKVGKLSETAFGNFSKCDQASVKESEPSLSVSTIPVMENSPGDCQISKSEIAKAKTLQFNTNESQIQISQEKEETSSRDINVSSKLMSSENLSAVCQTLRTDSSEIKVDKSAFLSKDTAWLVKANVSTAETNMQTEGITDGNVMKRKMDFLETKGDEVTATNASPAEPEHPQPGSEVITAADKPADPTMSQQTTTTRETPGLAALNLKTKQLEVQPQSAGSSAETPLGSPQKTGGEEENDQKVDVLTQKNPVTCFPNAAAPNRVESLLVTVGERIWYYLQPHDFKCVPAGIILSSKPYALNSTLLLITNLPVDHGGSYTEEEVVNVLRQFEFQYAHDNIYVIPQTGMAFVLMPNARSLIGLVVAAVHGYLSFRSKKLFLQIVETDMLMTPLGFYKSLIGLTPLNMRDDGISIIYIQNISPSDIADLRKALRKIGHVRNFLPLLNKVFVEFETVYDADRLGVWCSLMRLGFVHTVNRLKIPRSLKKSQPPKLPLKALPDGEKILPDAGIPDVKSGVPQGTTAPCWVTMMTPPYVFPTVCPWFNIPSFLTVQGEEDILTTPHPGSEFFTVMLTGLPEGKYKHEDVAKLVWRYFPTQNLQTLYYNILVLPLQRRAFVFFCDWEACRSFVSDCVKKPVSVRNCTLSVHLVLEDMYPGSSEETMYRTLMKWTSGYVPELFFLEKRLVSVEIYEANMNLIESIIKEVAAIGSFINFVPLTNRICIEMVSPSCAAKVLQEMPLRKVLPTCLWGKIGRVESVKDLSQRLEEAGGIEIKIEAEPSAASGQPSALKTLVDFPISEPRGDEVAEANSAAPPTLIESAVSKSGSKLEEKVSEPPDVVLDSKTEANSTGEECQPCREISSAADNAVGCTPHPDETIQTDPPSNAVGAVPDKSAETSPSVQTEAAAEEMVKEQPGSSLTAGERIGSLLQPEKICCLGHSIIMSPKPFPLQSRVLLVTNLPPYRDGCYSERDISNLLHRFGFQYEDKNIFVVPQACMAFVLMESYQKAQEVFIAANDSLTLNGCKLSVEIISSGVVMTTFGFYKSLMEMIDSPVTDDGTRTVYIQNVSPSEARGLRETLRKMGSVKNYLPLLNKVFIEFESAADADRIGVWYSLQRRCPAHNVCRIKPPQTDVTSSTPHLAATAAPESKDVVAGPIVPPIVPPMNTSIPEGSWAPFSVAMTTAPFLFPTVSPWFVIPKFRTVDKEEDLLASVSVACKFSTVMLTGLPEGNYKHEDVAKLVWKYFTKQNLQTLFYNIVVLPLQKRAFVYFNDWTSCNNFVQDFLKKGVSFTSHKLHVHLVLEEMNPGSSEDMMYQTLMKWSNARVPELESLDERLVCVALSETSLSLIMAAVKLVTNVSAVVSFLPLANRLCIEMAESRGVDQVVERFARSPEDWNSQVQSVESVKSLKQRLKDSDETKMDLERNTEDINDKTPATTNEPQPPLSDSPVKTKPPVQEVTNLPNSAPSAEESTAVGSGTKMEIAATENENVKSKVSEKHPGVCGKVQESAVVPKDKTETEEKKQQAKTDEVEEDKSESAAKSNVGKTEDEKLPPAKPTKSLISTPTVKPSKPLTIPRKSPQTGVQTSVKAPSQLQKRINPKPSVSAENPETKTDISGNSGSSAAVKNPASKVSAASAEIDPNSKSSTTATKSEPLAAAATSTEAFPLTPGEKLHHFLTPFKLRQLDMHTILSPTIFSLHITLVVTNLPRWFDGSYTETEIINVLQKCRVQCDENEIFVVPQSQMAFLIMPRVAQVQHLFRATPWRELFFKGRKLGFHVVTSSTPMTLFRFYRYLMSFTDFPTCQMKLGTKNVLYFPNISASEARDLREALRKISCFVNYLPLLNRVFVHCETPEDADRLEAWYSYWRWSRSHDAQQTALSGSAHGLQIWENISVETSVPRTAGAVPEGTKAPFWMTVKKSPYVVHTASPFFKVPAFQTVDRKTCARISERDLKFAGIMLTGLPNRSYTHEEVAMLVWRHFPEQNLHTLYNNVVVLPLQRRAFVIFSSSCACIRFLRDRNRKRVYFKGFIPNIHLLLEDLSLGSSEESMFRALMKWSNIHVPDLTSLGERLLVVEASGTNEHITMMVIKEVASIATFASFLPLSNRIYVEMAESSGVRRVVEKLSVRKLSQQHEAWKLVGRVESLLSRKERLKDCEKIAVNLELGTMSVKPEAALLKTVDKESAACDPLPDRSLTTFHRGTGFLQISSGSSSSFKSSSPSKPITKEMKISHSSSVTRDIPKSNKDCRSSASSTGKSSLKSNATSLSLKTQKDAPESMKPQINQSSSAGGSKIFPSTSSKTFKSLNEKDQQSKREAPLRASQTSSASSTQSTSSAATSAETPQSDKHGAAPAAAVAKADHKVSAESGTAKTQLGPRVATSNLNQDCFKAESLKEGTESKEKQKNNVRNPVKEGNDPLDSKHTAIKELLVAVKEENLLGKDEDSKVKLDQRMKTSSGEEGETLPIKQESSDNKYETKIKESSSETGEKTVCKDSVPDESPIHTFIKKTDRGANQDKSATVVPTISQSGKDVYAEQKEIRKDGLGASVQEEKPLIKDEGLAVKPDKKTRVSESEDGENPAKEQSLDKQSETRSKDISAEMETEEMVCKGSVQHKSGLRRSFRQTTRLANQDKTNEIKAPSGGKLTQTNSSVEGKEDRTPTRRRKSSARYSQQQNEEKGSPKNVISMTCNSRKTQEEEKEAATPRRRGRPKKKVRLVPKKTLEVSPKNVTSMTCNSRETQEEKIEATAPRRRGRPKKKVRPVPMRKPTTGVKLNPDGQTLERLQHKRKMDLSGPEPKRSCSWVAPVAASVRCPPYRPQRPLRRVSRRSHMAFLSD